MNIERFHNELAMRLGYDRIVKDKRILISVEETDDPIVTLKVQGSEALRFKASEELEDAEYLKNHEMRDDIKRISDAVNHAYIESTRELLSRFNR